MQDHGRLSAVHLSKHSCVCGVFYLGQVLLRPGLLRPGLLRPGAT